LSWEFGALLNLIFLNEDIFQEIFQKLISKVEIYEGGKVEIHYDFINPAGA